ncbi:hypothetical protein CHLRE_17g737084v5 [Chlamydomonas reinhardtii]|uniref:Uncharacterized protein n=1 Tax=Chlamydomonas reinhardtii TaxID=3055 RepID=A0A2K3CRG8_CHLRE|nr:uncharacterized protein CHLRE_17g737084v5 [Chlamydomonas reinhardtii]PNW70874.1 hypothetical protein CHLRE_17g737084v5 [Chlamydomonas reinhardtii]
MSVGQAQEAEADRLEQHAYSGPPVITGPQHADEPARHEGHPQRQHGHTLNWDDFTEQEELQQGLGNDDGGAGLSGAFVTALPEPDRKRGHGDGLGQGRARKHARLLPSDAGEVEAEYNGFPAAGGISAWPRNAPPRGPAAPYGRAVGPAGPRPSLQQSGAARHGKGGVSMSFVPPASGLQHGNNAAQEQGFLRPHQQHQHASQPRRQGQSMAGPTAQQPLLQGGQRLQQRHGPIHPQAAAQQQQPPQQQQQRPASAYGAPAARVPAVTAKGFGTAVTGAHFGGQGPWHGNGSSAGHGRAAFGEPVWSSGAVKADASSGMGHVAAQAGLACAWGPQAQVQQHPSQHELQHGHPQQALQQDHHQQCQPPQEALLRQHQVSEPPAPRAAAYGADGWAADMGLRSGSSGGAVGNGGHTSHAGKPSHAPRDWRGGHGGRGSSAGGAGGGVGGMWGDFVEDEGGADWAGGGDDSDGPDGLFVTCI